MTPSEFSDVLEGWIEDLEWVIPDVRDWTARDIQVFLETHADAAELVGQLRAQRARSAGVGGSSMPS